MSGSAPIHPARVIRSRRRVERGQHSVSRGWNQGRTVSDLTSKPALHHRVHERVLPRVEERVTEPRQHHGEGRQDDGCPDLLHVRTTGKPAFSSFGSAGAMASDRVIRCDLHEE